MTGPVGIKWPHWMPARIASEAYLGLVAAFSSRGFERPLADLSRRSSTTGPRFPTGEARGGAIGSGTENSSLTFRLRARFWAKPR
jgi:hypothetical protein